MSRATPEYRAALRTALNTPPQELGYGLSVWSLARLNAHLKKLTQIGFSEDQLGRIVHAEGFSFQRPKLTIKGKRDEVAYTRAAAKLKTIKNAISDDAKEVLIYQDEMEIHRHPALTRMWALLGQQPEIPAPGKNEKKVVYGCGLQNRQADLHHCGLKVRREFLAFLIVLVPQDNNMGERDIRSMAATRADGGMNRTQAKADAFANRHSLRAAKHRHGNQSHDA